MFLSGDPLATPPAQLLAPAVVQTYVGGVLRYQAEREMAG